MPESNKRGEEQDVTRPWQDKQTANAENGLKIFA